uniref:Magnesium transporter n=1 Tax=Corethron hystrix TaxID=216773 RepID=A0A6U5HFN1_9STRA|mmetsp:Transcript_30221/g.69272  ORF Transcript_30221/g.69272 Transcript_30221/m.69272 type:complete len:373 (+) Transcript_30221:1448-2566(+)
MGDETSIDTKKEKLILGVILNLFGSVSINLGNNIQILGYQKIAEAQKNVKSNPGGPCCNSPLYALGTAVFFSGTIINFVSFAFAPQSMLASLESIQFLTNIAFAKLILKKEIRREVVLGTILTVLGTCLAVQFSSRSVLEMSVTDLVVLYSRTPYIVYLCLSSCVALGLEFFYRQYHHNNAFGCSSQKFLFAVRISFVLSSSIVGTQSVVQAKILAELLESQMENREDVYKHYFTYISILLWIITASVWIRRLNHALSTFDPLVIIPMLQVAFMVLAIVSGGIFFEEFNTFTVVQWLGFIGGVAVMVLGLAMIAQKSEIDSLAGQSVSLTLPGVKENPLIPPSLVISPHLYKSSLKINCEVAKESEKSKDHP